MKFMFAISVGAIISTGAIFALTPLFATIWPYLLMIAAVICISIIRPIREAFFMASKAFVGNEDGDE